MSSPVNKHRYQYCELLNDTETEVYLTFRELEVKRKPRNGVYLGGKITSEELNKIATDIEQTANYWKNEQLASLAILTSAIAILFFAFGFLQNFDVTLVSFCYICIICSFFFMMTGIVLLYSYSKKSKDLIGNFADALNQTNAGRGISYQFYKDHRFIKIISTTPTSFQQIPISTFSQPPRINNMNQPFIYKPE